MPADRGVGRPRLHLAPPPDTPICASPGETLGRNVAGCAPLFVVRSSRRHVERRARPPAEAAERGAAMSTDVVIKTPMQYLDKATTALRDLGIVPPKVEDAPINALLQKISDLDQDKIAIIARTLGPEQRLQRGRARADAGRGDRRALPGDRPGLQLDPRRFEEDGRPDRRLEDRPPGARQQHLDEDFARRHRRPLRRDQGDLSRRHQLDPRADRARADHPRRLPRFSRRAEAGRGAGAGSAARGREEARGGQAGARQGLRGGRELQGHGARRARPPGA